MFNCDFSQKLVNLRGEKSQQEVADAVGITKQALWNYENGRRIPRDKVKIALANYYQVPVQDLFFAE